MNDPIPAEDLLPRCVLGLGIRSRTLSLDELVGALGRPTKGWSRGDTRLSLNGRSNTAAESLWSLEIRDTSSSSTLDEQVDKLLLILDSRSERFLELRPQIDSCVLWVTVYPSETSTAVWLLTQTLSRLSTYVDSLAIRYDDTIT